MKFTAFGFISQQGLDVEYLLVGGGQNGGNADLPSYYGIGGAAGQYISQRALLKTTTAYPVVVGAGGNLATVYGGSSSFAGLYAVGGGIINNGNTETASCSPPLRVYQAGGTGAATTGSTPYCVVDGAEQIGIGNTGGNGLQWYDGNYYAGGGGGGTRSTTYSIGGLGGGGNGGWRFAQASGAVANTGGGGGGAGSFGDGAGAGGGSGIVKVRYAGSGSKATGGTITYNDGYTYHSFTASATFTTL